MKNRTAAKAGKEVHTIRE